MKIKIVMLIISFGVVFSIYQFVFADAPSGILLEDHSFSSADSISSNSPLLKMVYLPDSPISDEETAFMLENLNRVHPVILKRALQQDVRIKFFTGKLTEEEGLRDLTGSTPRGYSKKTSWDKVPGMSEDTFVYVKIGHSKRGMGHGSVALELHEFAHAADRNVFSNVRSNPLYLNIWKQEARTLFPGNTYFEKFPEEYFAEIFAMYYLNESTRDDLREQAPLSYRFVANLYKSLENK